MKLRKTHYNFLKEHISDRKVIKKAENDLENVKFNYTKVENFIKNAKNRIDWTNAETSNMHVKMNSYEVLLPAFLYIKDNLLTSSTQNLNQQEDERLLQIKNEYEAKLEEQNLRIKHLEEQLNVCKLNQ